MNHTTTVKYRRTRRTFTLTTKNKDSLMRLMKDLLQQMVRNKVRVDVQKVGERVKIKVDNDEGELCTIG